MKVAYICGPYRAATAYQRQRNIDAARDVAVELWKMGFAVLCPHMNSANLDGECDDSVFLEGCLELMRRCDCVVWRGGPGLTSGVKAEVDEARRLEIPVFCWVPDADQIKAFAQEQEVAS
jgi:hypothetical protein